MRWLSLGLCLLVAGNVKGFPDDDEPSDPVCRREPPTLAPKNPGDNGFRIKMIGRPPPERYTPGQVYTVSLNGTYSNQQMVGFMLVAVPVNAEDETTQIGTFQHLHQGSTTFADDCPHVVTKRFREPQSGVSVLWTAPPSGAGCVEFRATVLLYEGIWYKDEGALTKVVCEEVAHVEGSTSHEMIPDCCACGTGKYQMTFEGLWSRQTHPKDWPENKRLLHWSNVVGASHSKDYMIWEYGGYATNGIKKVCEFGFSSTLEEEMRRHSSDVRTVVKTPGIYWSDATGLRQSRWARFSVDRKNHLLTMLTMMGPSPDWCVGVSALDLCLPNCSWAGDMVLELYPFDAGTDDGGTYRARDQKSEPQERIKAITAENAPYGSPFKYDEPLRPFARLTLHRIHPKPGAEDTCNSNSTLEEDDEFDTAFEFEDGDDAMDMEKKKAMMMAQASGKCAMTDWMDWSECSVTCGNGERLRKRLFTHPMGSEDMCGLAMMETERCTGSQVLCENIDDECAMTGWSDWSPCSVTCGKGVRERRRYYLRQAESDTCDREDSEQDMCIGQIMDCMKVEVAKNFTEICSLHMDVGPCRGFFMRWYYDADMPKCLKFPYGGCRGNDNRFRSLGECQEACHAHMMAVKKTGDPSLRQVMMKKGLGDQDAELDPREERRRKKEMRRQQRLEERQMKKQGGSETAETSDVQRDDQSDAIDCMVTEWSQWSECSATCGQSSKSRQRMIKQEAVNGGKKCPKKLTKEKRCKVPKCPIPEVPVDCQVSAWAAWSMCSATCGRAYKFKRRAIMQQPRHNGRACPRQLERQRQCQLSPCSSDCELGPWSDWSPCAKTCGEESIQERSRQILTRPRRGGRECDPRLERRFCMLPECPETSSSMDRRKRVIDLS